jgi:hypothetical protein
MKYAMTVRRIAREPSTSSWRKPGPITPNLNCCTTRGPRSASSLIAVVMGPGFRQDDAGRRRAASPHHPANPFICGTRQPPRPAAFPGSKFPFGNLALTMISVWLGSECRVKSPRFDMLAGEAGLGFGRAPHATDARGFRAVSPRLMRPWNRCRLAARLMGTLALRGYCR